MSRFPIQDMPVQIFPAGVQPAQRIFNVSTTTVFLDEYTSVSDISFPLTAGSSVVWDGKRSLFARCAPGITGIIYVLENQGPGDVGSVYLPDGTTIELAAGSSVEIPAGVAVTSLPPTDWFWPCATGEPYAPTLSSFSYANVGAMGCVSSAAINAATATWVAPGPFGPTDERYTILGFWLRADRAATTGSCSTVDWTNGSGTSGLEVARSGGVYTASLGGGPAIAMGGAVQWHYYRIEYDWGFNLMKMSVDGGFPSVIAIPSTTTWQSLQVKNQSASALTQLSSLTIKYRNASVL